MPDQWRYLRAAIPLDIPEDLENAPASRLRHAEQLQLCSASWQFHSGAHTSERARSELLPLTSLDGWNRLHLTKRWGW
jgi:hypothetical protein